MKPTLEILKYCLGEIDVQTNYKSLLNQSFPGCYPFRSLFSKDGVKHDGILEHHSLGLKLLAEFKFHNYNYEKSLSKRERLVECIIQAIYYLKRIDNLGEQIPNVILIADENVCYIFHSDLIVKYLDYDIDWKIRACDAANKNIILYKDILNNCDIVPKMLKIEDIKLEEIVGNIISLNKKVSRKMSITESTLNRFFTDFIENVLVKPEQYDANKLKGIFVDLINNPTENGLLEKNNSILATKNFGHIKVNGLKFKEFFSYVQDTYPPSDQDKFLEICDRLIEDLTRRFQGEFYTPTIWANEAHKMIEEEYGENWKEKYIVWDPAWGTGNLTRDYKFKELYCSTINDDDLKIGEKYNPEAVKFQYDFLNDDVSEPGIETFDEHKLERLAPGLVKALKENKPILIPMNPPYGSSGELRKDKDKKSKEGISKTKINKLMLDSGMARASLQLYSQFLFRIINLSKKYNNNNIHICIFVPPAILSTSSFKNFRSLFFSMVEFKRGMLFKAGNFANVQDVWPISFLMFSPGIEKRNSFYLEVKEIDINIIPIDTKVIYNTDNVENAATWVREEIKNKKFFDCPRLKSGLNLADDERSGKMCENAIGFIYYSGNVVYENAQRVALFSTTSSVEYNGFPIIPENFYKVISIYTARRLTLIEWTNTSDEYMKPNTEHEEYSKWNKDCIICSLFDGLSNQSSLRNIQYKNRNWNIENQFFWLSNKQMHDLSNQYNFSELYQDTKIFNQERFVYLELQKVMKELSPDALEVLNKANELIVKSFSERVRLHPIHPEWHLNTWDAGWYQIKLILKESMVDDLKEFRNLYKNFEERMREGVYKFGFLK